MPNPTQPSAQDQLWLLMKEYEKIRKKGRPFKGAEELEKKIWQLFPSIASLCLEQSEEIKRLRGALENEASMCVPYMNDDDQERHNRISQALSPSSHE